MFSSHDYQKYFEEIAIIERKMVYKLKPLLSAPLTPENQKILQDVWDDEIRHYAYARSILMEILKLPKDERRQFHRELFLGEVELKEIPGGQSYFPKLIDFSESGAGLEFDSDVPEDGTFEIIIRFYHDKPPVTQLGRIVWKRKITPGLGVSYLAGFSFKKNPPSIPSPLIDPV